MKLIIHRYSDSAPTGYVIYIKYHLATHTGARFCIKILQLTQSNHKIMIYIEFYYYFLNITTVS